MDVRTVQAVLNSRGLKPPLVVDGIPGDQTMRAIDLLLQSAFEAHATAGDPWEWSDARKLIAIEQTIYAEKGIDAGLIDGLVGELTRYARSVWEARQANGGKPVPAIENFRDAIAPVAPKLVTKANLVWPHQSEVANFYGPHGNVHGSLTLPFPMKLAWEPTTLVHKVTCHEKCIEAFGNIWKGVLDHYGMDGIKQLRLDMYGGCFNDRKMSGGTSWSMHAFGCAWDVDPDRNQLKFKRAQARLDDEPYKAYWDIVYGQGAIGLGPERDYDWMHIQFTRDLK
jgi:hypothetical protein